MVRGMTGRSSSLAWFLAAFFAMILCWYQVLHAAGTPLPYFREMRVVGATNVTPRMRRVRLKGRDLARFAIGGMHVRLSFPPKPGIVPQWPVTGEDGRP